jgi:hypothetical protein
LWILVRAKRNDRRDPEDDDDRQHVLSLYSLSATDNSPCPASRTTLICFRFFHAFSSSMTPSPAPTSFSPRPSHLTQRQVQYSAAARSFRSTDVGCRPLIVATHSVGGTSFALSCPFWACWCYCTAIGIYFQETNRARDKDPKWPDRQCKMTQGESKSGSNHSTLETTNMLLNDPNTVQVTIDVILRVLSYKEGRDSTTGCIVCVNTLLRAIQ